MNLALAKATYRLAILLLAVAPLASAQEPELGTTEQKQGAVGQVVNDFLNSLNMAGTAKASSFRPLTQHERNRLYVKTLVNPFGYIKAGGSAGFDQAGDKPPEWEQGASGYGKRYVNILGQYSIQRAVTYGLGSVLHEDNRYFNSGKTGFWPRTKYALLSGVLARHDDGSRHLSISQLGGEAAGAFVSRFWQPPSERSIGDGAVSFGITMGSNIGFSVLKEFLPDLGRAITKKHKP